MVFCVCKNVILLNIDISNIPNFILCFGIFSVTNIPESSINRSDIKKHVL